MAPTAAAFPAGLSLEQDGYRIVAERQALLAGRPAPYVFRILDPGGAVLRDCGERRTLGIDLQASGGTRSAEDPLSQYDVSLDRNGDQLDFVVRSGEEPVELQPYLGARGHLVVLREGDLAYIHAHADEGRLSFVVPFPSEGRYRLFLQFRVGDTVETASLAVTR